MKNLDIAVRAKDWHSAALMENPNVVYVAVVADPDDPETAIIEVGVLDVAMNDLGSVQADDPKISDPTPHVPKFLEAPTDVTAVANGDAETGPMVPVMVVETGELTLAFRNRNRPAQGGDSIGHMKFLTTGTLGAAVRISTVKDKVFVLSNHHVLAGHTGKAGDAIVQPAIADGGKNPGDTIANITQTALNQNVDCGIAEVVKTEVALVKVGGNRCYGAVKGKNYGPKIGDKVKKCGRSTNATQSTILTLNADAKIKLGAKTIHFRNQIVVVRMTKPGDSGSLLLDETDKAIGLIFAATDMKVKPPKRVITLANHIAEVEMAIGAFAIAGKAKGKRSLLEFQ